MRALKQLIGRQYPKNIDELIRESIKLRSPFQHFSTVIISDHDIVKGIAQSKPNNLILDNFGTWLAGLIRAPVVGNKTISLQDDGDVSRDVMTFATTAVAFNTHGAKTLGTGIKVGAGNTPAARDDFDIETAFIVAPEDDIFDTGTGSYAGGAVSVGGVITAGGAGTINETGLYGVWLITAATEHNFMLFHDILVSGEAFVLGNTITVAYTINL